MITHGRFVRAAWGCSHKGKWVRQLHLVCVPATLHDHLAQRAVQRFEGSGTTLCMLEWRRAWLMHSRSLTRSWNVRGSNQEVFILSLCVRMPFSVCHSLQLFMRRRWLCTCTQESGPARCQPHKVWQRTPSCPACVLLVSVRILSRSCGANQAHTPFARLQHVSLPLEPHEAAAQPVKGKVDRGKHLKLVIVHESNISRDKSKAAGQKSWLKSTRHGNLSSPSSSEDKLCSEFVHTCSCSFTADACGGGA